MKIKNIYNVSALVKGSRASEQIAAYSEKQAIYFFCKKWGWRGLRDLYAYIPRAAAAPVEQIFLF